MKATISKIVSLVLVFCCVWDEANAQRETFESSEVRRADAVLHEFSNVGRGGELRQRQGVSAWGNKETVRASVSAVSFDNIYFKLDSTELSDHASTLQLKEIASALKSRDLSGVAFLIEGHTCDIGEEGYNLKLSARRAEAVKAWLVKQGIASERLAVLGFGEEEPAVKLEGKESAAQQERKRAKNRRVVFRQWVSDGSIKQ